jgi:hypothetical protein
LEESKILCGNFEGIVKFQEMLYEQLKEVSEYVQIPRCALMQVPQKANLVCLETFPQ